MRARKKFLVSVFLLLSSSCTGAVSKIQCEPIERIKLDLEEPKPLQFVNVQFVVVTKDNAEKVFKTMEDNGNPPVLFSLSENDYKSLAVNMEEFRRYVLEKDKIFNLYKDYYENQ
jgi:hypothetical protein